MAKFPSTLKSWYTAPITPVQFLQIIQTHRVIVCVGSGGVGKTTTSAAIGLLAAQHGKNVLCLTIDPARRLAQSLGLDAEQADAQVVSPTLLEQAGIQASGSLTVMMLNTKQLSDELVERHASSPEVRDKILANRIYHYASTALSGTRDYLAIEKLHAVKDDPQFDIIILDTPPTSHALDFLNAPERMIEAMTNSAAQWFIRAFRSSDRLSFDLLARSAAIAMQGIAKLAGKGFLEQVAELLCHVDDMFGGFAARARQVQQSLQGKGVAFVLVTSPCPMAINEVLYFSERLSKLDLRSDAFVVNCVHQAPTVNPSEQTLRKNLNQHQMPDDPCTIARIRQAIKDEATQAARDESNLHCLDDIIAQCTPKPAYVTIPAYPEDVHDLKALQRVAKTLELG